MKKIILSILLVFLLCAALCGCGNDRTDHGILNNDMDLLPDENLMASPDVDNGAVTDQDGYIGNEQNGNANGSVGMPAASPSPDQNTGKTDVFPTTAPSTTPEP